MITTGKFLRSYSVFFGEVRHRVNMYEYAALLHTGLLGKGILITGANLDVREISLPQPCKCHK